MIVVTMMMVMTMMAMVIIAMNTQEDSSFLMPWNLQWCSQAVEEDP